ncbi:MAG TPA: ATP-dependent DNA helicase UvrD2 [Actinomycetaceae bacterium]|nr:ATP-dependent DNA helicase UvrD2 [Actinomycetaceae bacterium]
MRPDAESLLAHLDDDQRHVATNLRGPLCVLAGAGTGKTRAITYRIAHGILQGVYRPQELLAVTFTARAAGEMRSRLRDLGAHGVQARTFHSAALRQLSYFWPIALGGGQVPRLQEHKAQLVVEAAGRLGISVDRATIRDLAGEVEWAKVSMVTADDYQRRATAAGREEVGGVDLATVGQLIRAYEDVKTERGVIDFEDVLLMLIGILAEREDIADQVRRQYRYFVVDEYQDVSPLQQRLLETWLGERREICVVGDVSQTIYSFTGATPAYLSGFARRYPEAPVISLARDYRSTPQVVNLANRILTTRSGRMPPGAVTLIAQRPSSVPVRFEAFDDDVAEAEGVAERIGDLRGEGVPLSEIAVLYRTNSQSEVIEDVLSRAGIGYQVRGGERFFSRQEVRQAIVALRAASKVDEAVALPDQARAALRPLGWSPEPPAARGAVRERWDSLNSLVQLADDLYSARGSNLPGLVAELEDRAEAQNAPTLDGVTLASIHAAKGLEWDAVFLAGVSDGLVPISMATTSEEIAEERRLLYVGITRAREHLMLSYARARTVGGRGSRKHSRFLAGIWPEEEPRLSRSARGGAAARQKVRDEVAEEDKELFERLREWRSATAREISKPAYTVLHDTTLAAIATAKPKDLRQLALLRGIGATKLEAYGGAILAIVRGEPVLLGSETP